MRLVRVQCQRSNSGVYVQLYLAPIASTCRLDSTTLGESFVEPYNLNKFLEGCRQPPGTASDEMICQLKYVVRVYHQHHDMDAAGPTSSCRMLW
jgi:hypothetical protein